MSWATKLPDSPTREKVTGVSGGCSLGCAGFFALLATLIVTATFFPSKDVTMEGSVFFLPAVSFVGGHVFAFIALFSGQPTGQRAGRMALRILWASLALLLIAAFYDQHFNASPAR
jgi:ABC-type branched-subunit amino acid transport system permease subunit